MSRNPKAHSQPGPAAKIVTAFTARTQFGQILDRVKHGRERFVVDRRGEPQAVIMGVEEYLRKFAKWPAAMKALQAEAKANGTDRLTLREINVEIKRDRRERRHAVR